jgi:hypothetical protein
MALSVLPDVGKTAMAYDPALRQHFRDGILGAEVSGLPPTCPACSHTGGRYWA